MIRIPRSALVCLTAVLFGSAGLAVANDEQHDKHSSATSMKKEAMTDQAFVTRAAQANLAEIETSQLALEKAQSPEVRSFAQRMVQDHQKASAELQAIAQKKGLDVPTETDAKHQKELKKLKGLSGQEFDVAYSKGMERDHKKAVELFTMASRAEGLSPELQSFASKTLPTLQNHDRLASNLPTTESETRAAQAPDEDEETPTRR